jgi:hypothetical protein
MTDADEDYELIHTPLEREVSRDGVTIKILIYRGEHEREWVLEVEDKAGGSTVFDGRYATDQAALDDALAAIEEEGIQAFSIGE